MIRSNPTAIPLRASDLKHLQTAIEKRQQSTDAAASETAAESTNAEQEGKTKQGSSAAQTLDPTEQRKKDRAAMSVNERIGL
jgi:hypothetical protein